MEVSTAGVFKIQFKYQQQGILTLKNEKAVTTMSLCEEICISFAHQDTRTPFSTLTGPLQDIKVVVWEPFLWSFGFVLGLIVLLENKSSPKLAGASQTCVRFILQDFFIFCSTHFTLWPFPGPAAEKHPHSMYTMSHAGDGVFVMKCSATWCLVQLVQSSILVSPDHRAFFQLT